MAEVEDAVSCVHGEINFNNNGKNIYQSCFLTVFHVLFNSHNNVFMIFILKMRKSSHPCPR